MQKSFVGTKNSSIFATSNREKETFENVPKADVTQLVE